MSLISTKNSYLNGTLPKADYIREMHRIHKYLFEYMDLMKSSDISKIEILETDVVMTARENGVKFTCSPSDERIAPIEILNFGAYEKSDTQMMEALIENGYSVFDIGANFGWYSLHFSKKFKNLKVYAFEPIPSTFSYLKRNCEINSMSNIELFNFGLSLKEEDLDFYFYPEGSGNASSANLSERESVKKLRCHVKKLDSFVQSKSLQLDFIKCDVEGAELFVFQGGLESIRRDKPIVFTEMLRKWAGKFNYHPNEIIRLFAELGYRCFTAKEGKLAEFFEMTESSIETNFFFLHREKHAEKIKKHLS